MSLTEQLQADMKTAMRDGDAHRRDTLRMALAAVQNAAKDKRDDLTNEEALAVLTKQVKSRRESIRAYADAGRDDLAAKEQAEIDVLQPYLPEQLGEDEVRGLVLEAIASTGAGSPKDMGRVMGALMPRVKGRADGALVSRLVSEELAKAAQAT
ncbi:MAG: GatB/YqeY domain-containing protein [Candidatus Limnocylindrales bacterium]